MFKNCSKTLIELLRCVRKVAANVKAFIAGVVIELHLLKQQLKAKLLFKC